MRVFRAGVAALCLAAATAACSGSGSDTGSAGGWRVSGTHIRISGLSQNCPTAAPVLDTFSVKQTPQPGCSPAAQAARTETTQTDAPATSGPASTDWQSAHVEQYRSTASGWTPIYTTYTAPPASGVYQPMVHATTQPMPTPFTTPTPVPLRTSSPASTVAPIATQAPVFVQVSPMP